MTGCERLDQNQRRSHHKESRIVESSFRGHIEAASRQDISESFVSCRYPGRRCQLLERDQILFPAPAHSCLPLLLTERPALSAATTTDWIPKKGPRSPKAYV
jgi:hypothetical protein